MKNSGNRLWWGLLLLIVVCGLVFASCSSGNDHGGGDDDVADDDAVVDDDTQADDDVVDDDAVDDDTGPWDNLSDQLGAGEVRAGMITASDELIGGFRSRGETGDYKIYNSRVRFVIRSPENPGVGWFPYSGNLIDADRAGPANVPGNDGLWADEQLVGLLRGYLAKKIEVISDGHDQPAIIRVTGKDGGIDLIDHVAPTWDYGLTIITDYILYPDTDYLVLKTTLKNKWPKDRRMVIGDAPLWGDEMSIFMPKTGYNVDDPYLLTGLRWIAGVSRSHLPVSYALATIDPKHTLFVPYLPAGTSDRQNAEILPVVEGDLHLPASGEVTYTRLFIVGTGDTASIQAILNAFDHNTEYGTLSGQLQLQAGDNPADIDVVVQDAIIPDGKNYMGVARPDANGAFSIQLPPGEYKMTASGNGRVDSMTVEASVTSGQTTNATVPIDPPGFISVTATDGDGAAIPAKFSFQQGFNALPDAQVVNRIWTDGTNPWTEPVLPGDYTVTASRGYEYEIDVQNVTVVAGETASISSSIAHVVDTTGYMNGDFHIHSEYSVDAEAVATVRVRTFMGEGLEMPVNTEHDYMADFMPLVDAINGRKWVHPVRGAEISPVEAHFNAWPLTPPAGAADYFGIRFSEYDDGDFVSRRIYPDMWEIARQDFGASIIKINHPRSSTSGWFNTVHYDRTIGVSSANPNLWSDDFDALEVWNSGSNGDDLNTFLDWFSLLDQGYTCTMMGGSDSHAATVSLGNPRDLFVMPTDSPADADPMDMVDSILHHRSEVSNGPFITFSINGQSIGSLVTGVGGDTVNLDIVVQAPSWVAIDYVKVYSNHGAIIDQEVVSGTNVIRFTGSIPATSAVDAYFVVEAGSTTSTLSPVNPGGRVFAITNPIWVDFDGNGQFDAPGLSAN